MGFFAWPYRVLFHDTMAFGWHHFLTNFKFQCEAREHFFFEHVLDTPDAERQHEDIQLLTYEGYSRNLGPVAVGQTVGILMSYEDVSPSSVRCCFRVVRADGEPICCGFQRMVSASAKTGQIVPMPPGVRRHAPAMKEKLVSPSFAQRVLTGVGLKAVFDDEVIRLAKETANGPHGGSMPRLRPAVEGSGRGVVFLFPGTGSFSPGVLSELAAAEPSSLPFLRYADEVVRDQLGLRVAPLFDGNAAAEHLKQHPELAQIGAYLASAVTARYLTEHGVSPDLTIGHSLGEIAALAAGGAFSYEAGVEVVAQRMRALQPISRSGGMLVLFCREARAKALLDVLAPSTLEISVVNLPDQTVVSGRHGDLDRVHALAGHLSIGCSFVDSFAPFHSSLLEPCVKPWATALSRIALSAPSRAVYSPLERRFYKAGDNLAELLPSHFVRPLNFDDALESIYDVGGRTFIECGSGKILTGVGKAVLGNREDVVFKKTLHPAGKFAQGLEQVVEDLGTRRRSEARQAPAPAAVTKPAPVPAARPRTVPRPPPAVAVVGMGCVLPDALDPEALWAKVLSGQTAIHEDPPHDARDFTSENRTIQPDKTYSLLGGWIRDFKPDPTIPAFRTASQRYLAVALVQCLAGLASPLPDARRIQVLLGSTGDGCREYDSALLLASTRHAARKGGIRGMDHAARLDRAIETAIGTEGAGMGELSPWLLYRAVCDRLLGAGTSVVAIDAACASSLYAIGTGLRALNRGDCDMVFAGGVFCPGAANACLFAQFGGLSRNGSRPLDIGADGVVFSEGSGLLILKRLSDAIASGDRIHAVIRGVSYGSDGKSPSVMEPRKAGQILTLRRAYAQANIETSSIQYLEAHATATPVGDAVEISSAGQVLRREDAPIALGSVKAVFGHTGWAAGVTSMIKTIKAMETRTIPPQACFTTANPRLELDKSTFEVATQSKPWPANGNLPRRAAVNGFGFGGSNAHVIVESFDPEHHRQLVRETTARGAIAATSPVVIVSVAPVIPTGWPRFTAAEVTLPESVLILPDVVDHMDRAQILALMAASRALASLPGWQSLAEEAGAVLGVEGKTGRGVDANIRVFADQIRRRLSEGRIVDGSEHEELIARLSEQILSIPPSGPYTLLGIMPNVISGRVANAFNFKGPNVVLDTHRTSLASAMTLARSWIDAGDAQLVLAGGIQGAAHPAIEALVQASETVPEKRPIGEAALMVAMTSLETARAQGWPVLALMHSRPPAARNVGSLGPCLLGAEGALELVQALNAVSAGKAATAVSWGDATLEFAPAPAASETPVAPGPVVEPISGAMEFCQPRLFPAAAATGALPLAGRKLLVVTDQPSWALGEGQELLAGLDHRFVMPSIFAIPGAISLDLTSDEAIDASLRPVGSYDAVLVVRQVGADPREGTTGGGLIEAAFAMARHAYARLEAGEVVLASLFLGNTTPLHPMTGLFSGFMKSLARELPRAVCRAVATDAAGSYARAQLETELGTGPDGAVEAVYTAGVRQCFKLVPVTPVARSSPWLAGGTVALVTGGARGITAVLMEALLERTQASVYLLGRSDLGGVPAPLLALDDAAFDAHEATFYAEELKGNPQTPMSTLKMRFEQYRAGREAVHTLERLQALPGKVHYVRTDVTDPLAVEAAMTEIMKAHGRLDLVIHGAGVQTSKLLSRRKLKELRQTLGTKLTGLWNIYDACARAIPDKMPHFHLLTSAFSYVGNPGQEDYGAANECMDRIAAYSAPDGGSWSTLGWLGWEGVGMTRGSEYRAMAQTRKIQWVSREEGKQVFAALLNGPSAPVNVLTKDRDVAGIAMAFAAPDGNSAPPPRDLRSAPRVPAPVPVAPPRAECPAPLAHTVDLLETALPAAVRFPLENRKVLVLLDRVPEPAVVAWLSRIPHQLVAPAHLDLPGTIPVDIARDETIGSTIARLDGFAYDCILAVKDLRAVLPDEATRSNDALLELLLAVSRHAYDRIASGSVPVAVVELNAWHSGPNLHPTTGLFAGFCKSLARELPSATVRAIALEAPEAATLLETVAAELGGGPLPATVEVAYRAGRRYTFQLVPVAGTTMGEPVLGPNSVVLAVGGARGVTAVLVEAIQERFGCTVVMLGRSDPRSVTTAVADMTDAALAAYETEFYDEALAREPGIRPAEIKARWKRFLASREARLTLRRLLTLPGRISYIQADVTDAAAVDAAVARIVKDHGQIDMVLYGAGVQTSRLLSRRSLVEFRDTLATKLKGIGNLEAACLLHLQGIRPHFHVLSSAAGVAGNPGQADYSAANEGLNRLAQFRAAEPIGSEWTTVSWLAWHNLGMAVEYSGMAQESDPTFIGRAEGKAFFNQMLEGRSIAPVIVPLRAEATGKIPGLTFRSPEKDARGLCMEWPMSTATHPFLTYHLVDNVPTVPGAYLIDLATRSAVALRPNLRATRIEMVHFERFVKVFSGREAKLKAVARVISETEAETSIQVRLLSDFVHASGQVLRKDMINLTARVTLSSNVTGPAETGCASQASGGTFVQVPDPYFIENANSRVRLGGPFPDLERITVAHDWVSANLIEHEVEHPAAPKNCLVPTLLFDALGRMSAFDGIPGNVIPIYAPVRSGAIFLSEDPARPVGKLRLIAGRRVADQETLSIGWAEVRDASDRLILRVENLLARRMGEVPFLEAAQMGKES